MSRGGDAGERGTGRAERIVPKSMPGGTGSNRPPRILGTVAHHPHLLEPMLRFSAALAGGVLPRRDSELLALRAAWNCRSEFEWGHHVRYGLEAGLSEEEIARIAVGAQAPGWSARDALLLRAADELHTDQDLTDATWRALATDRSEAELVEIPFVVGQYTMLSMVAKATGVPVDETLPKWPGGTEGR